MKRTIIYSLLGIFLLSGVALAQGDGQICVRAFEDRNADGLQTPGEPNITQGISADLLNAQGIIIASALLDDSPRAAQGILCFQNLEPGQYTVNVASTDYVPTLTATYGTFIDASSIPDVFDFGAQLVVSSPPVAETGDFLLTPAQQRALLQRIFLASLGAAFVVGAMAVLGAIIYFVRYRSPRRRYTLGDTDMALTHPIGAAPPVPARPATGTIPPVGPAGDTGRIRSQPPVPSQPPARDTGDLPLLNVDQSDFPKPYEDSVLPEPLDEDDTNPRRPDR